MTAAAHGRFGAFDAIAVQQRIKRGCRVNFATGCWLWAGHRTPTGYAPFTVAGRTEHVHRASYLAFVGDIPDRYDIDHLCNVRSCCNPKHLEAVPHRENMRRAHARRRGNV